MQNPPDQPRTSRSATIPMFRATLLSLPISFAIIGVFLGLFWLLWGSSGISAVQFSFSLFFMLALFIGIVLHELLHAVGWMVAGRVPWSAMKFGMNWKVLAPYAHCRLPLSARAYRIGILLPGFALGILPGMAGLVAGDFPIALWGFLFTAAASGDLLGYWAFRSVPHDARVMDHPTELGCEVIQE